jgi:DNA-binding beta-propeller fold protein YncE
LIGYTDSSPDDLDIYGWSAGALSVENTASLDGAVTGIALPTSNYIHYDLFAITSDSLYVINSMTGDVVQSIPENNPVSVVASPDGRKVYVVNSSGGGESGSDPSVSVIETANIGTANDPTVATYAIPQSAGAPFDYSLSSIPTPAQAAISPSGDTLLITDSTNSDVLSLDVGEADSSLGDVVAIASLNGDGYEFPQSISLTPDGGTAYVVDQGSSSDGITVLHFNGNRGYDDPTFQAATTLTDDAGDTLQEPLAVETSYNGQSAYVLDGNSSEPLLFQFPIALTGSLETELQPAIPAGTSPVSLSLSPEDSYAYIADSATDTTSALEMSTGSVAFATSGSYIPGMTTTTPDGLSFVSTEYEPSASGGCGSSSPGFGGLSIFSTADGTDIADVDLGASEAPTMVVASPVSSTVWYPSTESTSGGESEVNLARTSPRWHEPV